MFSRGSVKRKHEEGVNTCRASNSRAQLERSEMRGNLVCLAFLKEFPKKFLQVGVFQSYVPASEHELPSVGYLHHHAVGWHSSADGGLRGPFGFPCESS